MGRNPSGQSHIVKCLFLKMRIRPTHVRRW